MRPPFDLDYELLDAGDGEKLERFGALVVARPSPASRAPRFAAALWSAAAARFTPDGGWRVTASPPDPWIVEANDVRFHLALGDGGQVGYFPEFASLRAELARAVASRVAEEVTPPSTKLPPRVLDLFAYTGGTSLALAKAGARVVTIDASRTAIAAARRNATENDLSSAPTRWIVEDACMWVARERRRGTVYDVVCLDPPSFGRAPGGREFRLERDLDALLEDCAALLSERPIALVATAHTEGWTADHLAAAVDRALALRSGRTEAGPLELVATSGARLAAGIFARRTFSE